ncbi:MAG: hypothetical protein CMJ64_26135 [Planctomycetaceae bacterium]|nr:hypothetical protein [Planctomycetaceae bacterium]
MNSGAEAGEHGECGFCQKDFTLVGDLVSTKNGVQICQECASIARTLLDDQAKHAVKKR